MTQHHGDPPNIVGGVDTHKDLHVAAVVDSHGRVLGTASFPTTRHGYKTMLAWLRSFGELSRVGIECTGTYGAGLLRYLQRTGITVLEPRTRPSAESVARTIPLMRRMPPTRHMRAYRDPKDP